MYLCVRSAQGLYPRKLFHGDEAFGPSSSHIVPPLDVVKALGVDRVWRKYGVKGQGSKVLLIPFQQNSFLYLELGLGS